MTPAWRTPGAILLGSVVIASSVLLGAARIAAVLDRTSPTSMANPPGLASTSARRESTSSHAPTASVAPASSSLFEAPIVTYDSFDRRFAGALTEEAEQKCWKPAVARGFSEDVVYLMLDVAKDGTVEHVEADEPPPKRVPDPQVAGLRPLHACIAELAKKVRFMPLPEPAQRAHVAAHRHAER